MWRIVTYKVIETGMPRELANRMQQNEKKEDIIYNVEEFPL